MKSQKEEEEDLTIVFHVNNIEDNNKKRKTRKNC